MPSAPVIVYDQNMRKVAYLENAANISYETPLNALWTASFSLPANDPKNVECQPLRFVEIFDGRERVELFRILPTTTQRGNDGKTVTYQCEHVLATLLDDVLFQYHQIGGIGVYTADVLQYILSKQTVQRWQLGTVQFARQFEYNWENENLLGALFSVPKPFVEEYQWAWDTTVYPWKLHLVEPSDEVQAYIRYGVNLRGITKEVDPSNLCTRLYCLGYGEGVNQLTISEVNGGKPYLDADTQNQYGIITRIFVDRRFEDPATLKARGEALLNEMKHPRISYSVEAAELYNLTRDPLDKFRVGAVVHVRDQELGIDIRARVVNVRKQDLFGAPGNVQLEIANRQRDIAGSMADLDARQRINEVHAQGATNIDTQTLIDNCDPDHPAVLKFFVPEEAVRINKVLLTYRSEAFRAYSKAAKDGGGDVISSRPVEEDGLELDFTWNETEPAPDGHKHEFRDFHIDQTFFKSHTHRIQLPKHRHDIEYGIYQGPTPTAVTVHVDGNVVPGLGTSANNVNIVPYLSKDNEGKIARGQWHEITITPNDLGRIVASVIVQLFVQSRGGGDY